MTANLHSYTIANISSLPEDDEVLVFQAPFTPITSISLSSQYSTQCAIAAPIEKCPY